MKFDDVEAEMWVIVVYKGEKLSGKVQDKNTGQEYVNLMYFVWKSHLALMFLRTSRKEKGYTTITFLKLTSNLNKLKLMRMGRKQESASGSINIFHIFLYLYFAFKVCTYLLDGKG